MPKSNKIPGYEDPFTPGGLRLGSSDMFVFDLHETGFLSLAASWNYPGVRSPFWRLFWSDRPGLWLTFSGHRYDVEPSRIMLVPSHIIFDTHGAPHPVNFFWIHFSLHPDLTGRDNAPIYIPGRGALLRQVAALARKIARSGPSNRRENYHLCGALLHQVFAKVEIESQSPRLPTKLYRLLQEIELSLDHALPVPRLAAAVGMSRGGFIHWFCQHIGISPARYILSRRIDHACRMLKFSSATIEEIAGKLGFANRSHFSRAFQKQIGSGPATFRHH